MKDWAFWCIEKGSRREWSSFRGLAREGGFSTGAFADLVGQG